jgi:intein-encoded DNA endonuclease-like protein
MKIMQNIKRKLNSNWVTGFVDAEGCFYVRISRSEQHKTGWGIYLSFEIGLNSRDEDLLLQIKSFFNFAGNVYKNKNVVKYQVRSINELTNVIIPHFEKYPLLTQKQNDFIIFRNIIELINKREHLTKDGLLKIVNLKASLNWGLSDKLKSYFPEAIKIKRPLIKIPDNINYNWIAGFFSGESCFFINIYKNNQYKIGYSVKLEVRTSQHSKEKLLLNNIMYTLECGTINKHGKDSLVYIISGSRNINKLIIFFTKYEIKGVKSLDFQDFCKAAELINKRIHITIKGLKEIINIKSKMNKTRYITP